jgi:hypothetical protein
VNRPHAPSYPGFLLPPRPWVAGALLLLHPEPAGKPALESPVVTPHAPWPPR